jgi:hypothetical protein
MEEKKKTKQNRVWLSGFGRSNDEVVKLYQHIGQKMVDLELDVLGALQT